MSELVTFISNAGGSIVSKNILSHKGKLRWCVREEAINDVVDTMPGNGVPGFIVMASGSSVHVIPRLVSSSDMAWRRSHSCPRICPMWVICTSELQNGAIAASVSA